MAHFSQNASASAGYEPSCTMVVRRACGYCGAANPHGLPRCAACGGDTPPPEYRDASDVIWGFPLSLLFGLAKVLRAWAKRLED